MAPERDRIERAEEDIRWLRNRQDKQADDLAQLRSDLRADLHETEARLERRITDSHEAVVSEIAKVEGHLERQDDLLRAQLIREDDLIAARLVWPSRKYWAAFVLAGGVVSVVLHLLGVA